MRDPKRVQSLILNLLFSSSFLATPTKLVTFYILTLIVYCVRIWSVYHFVLCCLLLICQFSPTNYNCPHADWARSSYCCYFLDELPGLVDFTVFLNLSPRQKREVIELKKLGRKFKISSDGSALYVHPQLKHLSKNTSVKDRVDQVRIDEMLEKLDERGVKAKFYLNLLRLSETSGEKLLVFSQYLLPMMFLERLTVKVKGWSLGKEIFVIISDSENEVREVHMEQFNNSPDAKVFFGSNKACGEGISLVGASRIIILDVHLNPSVTRQAIGPAFRPGQVKKVFTYRLVASGSPEEEDHSTCFRKESIAKLWFEWNKCCGPQDFQMETVDVKDW